MEKIAAKLAGLLVERRVIEDSMYDIYHYGMLLMLEIGAAFFSSLLICLSMGMIKEGLLFFAFFIPLRSYLGGVHCNKYWQCYLASCLTLCMTLTITKYVLIDPQLIGIVTVLGVGGTVFAAFTDYKKQRNKIYLLIICIVLSLLILLAGLFYIKENLSMMLLLCCTISLVLGSKIMEQLIKRRNTGIGNQNFCQID